MQMHHGDHVPNPVTLNQPFSNRWKTRKNPIEPAVGLPGSCKLLETAISEAHWVRRAL